jgi:hypothetical protein
MDGETVSSQTPTDVEILSAKEAWSEYRLADGTILRLKPIMIGISCAETQSSDGDPVYSMKSTVVTDVKPGRS